MTITKGNLLHSCHMHIIVHVLTHSYALYIHINYIIVVYPYTALYTPTSNTDMTIKLSRGKLYHSILHMRIKCED